MTDEPTQPESPRPGHEPESDLESQIEQLLAESHRQGERLEASSQDIPVPHEEADPESAGDDAATEPSSDLEQPALNETATEPVEAGSETVEAAADLAAAAMEMGDEPSPIDDIIDQQIDQTIELAEQIAQLEASGNTTQEPSPGEADGAVNEERELHHDLESEIQPVTHEDQEQAPDAEETAIDDSASPSVAEPDPHTSELSSQLPPPEAPGQVEQVIIDAVQDQADESAPVESGEDSLAAASDEKQVPGELDAQVQAMVEDADAQQQAVESSTTATEPSTLTPEQSVAEAPTSAAGPAGSTGAGVQAASSSPSPDQGVGAAGTGATAGDVAAELDDQPDGEQAAAQATASDDQAAAPIGVAEPTDPTEGRSPDSAWKLKQLCARINRPLDLVSPELKSTVGYIGLINVFLGLCLIVYTVLT